MIEGITSKGQGNPPRTMAWDRKLETGSPHTEDLITDCSPAYLKVQERFSPQKRNERAKTFDSQRGEKKEKSTIPAEAPILMINQEEACTRNKISKIPTFEGIEITFPPVTKGSNSSALVIIKAKIFRREVAPLEDNRKKVGRKMDTKLEETKPRYEWKLYTDGASSSDGSSTGLMLIDPEGKEYTYALCFEFKTTNNEAKYEALLAGLRIAQEIEIVKLAILVDFQLLVNQIKGIYASKQPAIREYLQRTKETLRSFKSYTIEHIRRNQNKKDDALSKLALMTFEHLTKEVLVKVLTRRSIEKKKVLQVETKEEKSWMTSIHEYLLSGLLPEDSKDSKNIRIKAP
nr:reverse transcriptase domain-containing protein [Tanacetum cinerariifolium]